MKSRYGHLLVAGAYVLLTLGMLAPFSFELNTHLLESTNDFWIFPWNNWWIKQALSHSANIYQTPYLFYPVGAGLYFHSISWLNSFLWLPLQALLGALAAHNVTMLLTYVVAACTGYMLAYEVTGSRPAAFVGGLVYGFYPHRFAHRGQLNLLSDGWNALFAYFLVRVGKRGRLLDGAGAGVALALAGLSGWHQMLLASLWGALWAGCTLLAKRCRVGRSTLAAVGLGALVCLLLTAPLILPVVTALTGSQPASAVSEDDTLKSTDLLAFWLPNREHSLLQLPGLAALYDRVIHFDGPAATVGWAVLGLIVVGSVKRWRQARLWLASALVFALLALGPALEVNGLVVTGNFMPFALLRATIVGELIRYPNRFNIILALPVSVLAGLGMQALLEMRARRRRSAVALTLVVAALILGAYCVAPVPTVRPPRSAFYQTLREEPGEFAVADFPIHERRDKYYMYAQTLHQRPMVGGHVSRPPADAYAFIDRVPLLTAGASRQPALGELPAISRELAPLAEAGVRYVLIHKVRAPRQQVEAWRAWFGYTPVFEDRELLAYRTAPEAGRDFELERTLTAGVGVVHVAVEATPQDAPRALEVVALWGVTEPPRQSWLAELALIDADGATQQSQTFELVEGWPSAEWPANALGWGRYTLQIDPQLPAGAYELALALAAAGSGQRLPGSATPIATLELP